MSIGKFIEAKNINQFSFCNGGCRVAFTLAEVLITLGIIGIVAVLVLPPTMQNIQSRVRTKRIENIEQKLSKATDKMHAVSGLIGYASTEDFVNELKKHLSLAKVCDNNNLGACWPYESVITRKDGTTWEMANTKEISDLKLKNKDGYDWDRTMGIVTSDGVSMILSYNKACNMDTNISPSWSGSRSSSLNCIAAVYDWNGSKKPNSFVTSNKKRDVFAINANGLGNSCSLEIGNSCYGAPFTNITPLMESEQTDELIQELGINRNFVGLDNVDYWAGAVRHCGGVNNVITRADLDKIALQVYKKDDGSHADNVSDLEPIENGYKLDVDAVKALGFEIGEATGFNVWSGNAFGSSFKSNRYYFSPSHAWNWNFHGGEAGMVYWTACKI